MKKIYMTPDLSIVTYTLRDVILTSPIEGSIPISGNDDTSLPDDELTGDGL